MTLPTQEHMRLSVTRPPDSTVAFVRIVGDVDMTDTGALDAAARQLLAVPASVTYVDLGGASLVGSTLVAFLLHLADVRGAIRRPLVLCRPTLLGRKVIRITGLDKVAEIWPDLPSDWPAAVAV
jgi:anti-anti-sigma regulatory factor